MFQRLQLQPGILLLYNHFIMERKIEGTIMASVFILVAGCFSIPIIIYATSSQDSNSDSIAIEILADQFNVNECSQQVRSYIDYPSRGPQQA